MIWQVIGLSRKGGQNKNKLAYMAVDLLNKEESNLKLRALTNVTHIFYAAYQDKPTWAALVPPNMSMLENLVEAVEPVAKDYSISA